MFDVYDKTQIKFPDLRPGQPRVLTQFRQLVVNIYDCDLPVIPNTTFEDSLFEVIDLMDCLAANTLQQ